MTATDDEAGTGFSLRRWSRRKLAAARGTAPATDASPAITPTVAATPAAPVVAGAAAPATDAAPVTAGPASDATPRAPSTAAPPPVESLTFDSDFTRFLQPDVDTALRRQALRKLFQDPRFNVMDGLDVYIDDYGRPDPIPPEMLQQIAHAKSLLRPPATRINAKGEVELVPPDEVVAVSGASGEGNDEKPAAIDPPPTTTAERDSAALPASGAAAVALPDAEGTRR